MKIKLKIIIQTLVSAFLNILIFYIMNKGLRFNFTHSLFWGITVSYFVGFFFEIVYTKVFKREWHTKNIHADLIGVAIGTILLILIKI